jgi:hypothetical protein
MLEHGYDAIPVTRRALSEFQVYNDRNNVITSLFKLHQLLYAGSKLPLDKPGLSRNIRTLLGSEALQ